MTGPNPPRHLTVAGNGIVSSASPRAAAVGLRVLQDGGNAFDAAIATASIEWLTLPGSCGLGGDMFAVLYDAKSGRIKGINGSGVAGSKATYERYTAGGATGMPLDGWHAAAVPGAAHAYATLNREFGTRPLSELLATAIDYAENGVVACDNVAGAISGSAGKLGKFSYSAAQYLPKGKAPALGERWLVPDLARSIRTLAEEGAESFYKGAIAKEMVRASDEDDGPFTLDDFARHETEIYDPPTTRYRDVDVYTTAPPSQGLINLLWLNILEGFDLRGAGFGTADAIHLMVEAKKRAFADRLRYLADPRFNDNPINSLLSKSFAERSRATIDPARASDSQTAGDLSDGDTSYFCVADGHGNAISFIHSLSAGFGSGVVAGSTGIILNNRAGRGFSLDPDHINVVAPGKKTMHTLNCYMLARDGRPWVVGGTPGGDRQPQWNVQAITAMIDFEMNVREAVDSPSWISWPGTDPAAIDTPLSLRIEEGFGDDVIADLESRGHRIDRHQDWSLGSKHQLIALDGNGILTGASDLRYSGGALGY